MNELTVHTTRTKNELFYARSYFAEAQWIEVLGAEAFCLWKRLITRVDRTEDGFKHYGNRTTVPFSLTKLAPALKMSLNTLKKYARILWNAGLIDFIEYEKWYQLGKKPLNINVYNYPKNDVANATKEITFFRDYDKDFEAGRYEVYARKETAAIYAPDTENREQGENKRPFDCCNCAHAKTNKETEYDQEPTYAMEPPAEDNEDVMYLTDELYEFLYSNDQNLDNTHGQNLDTYHIQDLDGTYGHNVGECKYISNTLNNNTNTINNNSNIINNSSSSLQVYSYELNKDRQRLDEEEEETSSSNKLEWSLIESVLKTVLEAHSVSKTIINRIVKLAKERNITTVNAAMIETQLANMAREKESGKTIFSFEKYFINGLELLIESESFYAENTQEKRFARTLAEQVTTSEPGHGKPVPFYNWLEDRGEDRGESEVKEQIDFAKERERILSKLNHAQ